MSIQEKSRTKAINRAMELVEEIPNDDRIAVLFMLLNDDKVICVDRETFECYYFNKETTLYTLIKINGLAGMVTKVLSEKFNGTLRAFNFRMATQKLDKDELAVLLENIKTYKKLIKKVGCANGSSNIAKVICRLSYNTEFKDKLDTDRDVVNFKNCYVNLKDGKCHNRTIKDYFSYCLPYKYSKKYDEEIMIEVHKIIFQILNCDKDHTMRSYLHDLGYCLTGHTNYQRALWSVGELASNGKSTLFDIFASMFSVYSQKMDNRTFDTGYSKQHKQLNQLKGKRFAYIEELGTKNLNVQLLKDFIDGRKIGGNEILFGTCEEIILYCKLGCASNAPPKFSTDEGMRRRGKLFKHINRFVTNPQKENEFPIDRKLALKFENDEYKLALFHLLLPYAKSYYVAGTVKYDEILIKNWEELCMENDTMMLFTEAYYTKSNNKQDRIPKDIFLSNYRKYTGQYNTNWYDILNDIKRTGLIYDRTTIIKDPKNSKTYRGVIRGLIDREITKDDEVYEKQIEIMVGSSDEDSCAWYNDISFDPDSSEEIQINDDQKPKISHECSIEEKKD